MTIPVIGSRVAILKQKFAQSVGLPVCQVLPEAVIEEAVRTENLRYRQRIFSPAVTVWAFLCQVLDADRSCRNAVSRVVAWLAAIGQPLPSSDASAYNQARHRLPEGVLARLFRGVAQRVQARVTPEHLWHGHRVVFVDGSTVSLPDTPANQAAYPQVPQQAPGCGFPLARIVALFSAATGAVVDLAIGAWQTAEVTLARFLYRGCHPGDVVVGDRLFGSYADLALLQARQIAGVFRLHPGRKTSVRREQRLGKNDYRVTWPKPKQRPPGLSPEDFAALPPTLTVRLIRYPLPQAGFRTRRVTLVTTLLDAAVYPAAEIAALYSLRWTAELTLRALKTTMGMETLRTQTPAMIRKELYCYLLAYNLLRTVMWDAGQISQGMSLRLSVQGTLCHLRQFLPLLAQADPPTRARLYATVLRLVATERLPERPGRREPRVRKRRPKAYPLMHHPRHELRRALAA